MYEILKDFNGSQDGLVTTSFTKGETVEISDYLLGCIDKSWVKEVAEKQEVKAKDEFGLKNKSGDHK